MEVMCLTDDQMVRYAIFKLAAKAERWWIAKKEHLEQQLGEGISITWTDFKEAFLERFFPLSVWQAKAQEFTELMQGSLIVEQYIAKFIELLQFAPYLVARSFGFTSTHHEPDCGVPNWQLVGSN
ncbi:hypothetical protein SLA2020_267900 [Shorea laevis]